MMPAKIIRDTPFPMPFSLICSPSHSTNIAPAVQKMITVALTSIVCASGGSALLSMPRRPRLWNTHNTSVNSLVRLFCCLRAYSPPSLSSCFQAG